MTTRLARSRQPQTDDAYLHEGRRHLDRARKRHPEIEDPVAALVALFCGEHDTLCPSTVNLYRQQLAAIMAQHCLPTSARYLEAWQAITHALAERRGRPADPRTASRKVRHVLLEEVSPVLALLADRVTQRNASQVPAATLALALYLLPRLGPRPIEWAGARLCGTMLTLRCAKINAVRGGVEERTLDLRDMHPLVRRAVPVFLNLLVREVDRSGSFKLWYKAASEMLADLCRKTNGRRLCFSAFRGVALRTWREAGAAPWIVAALAGHGSQASARRYYYGRATPWDCEGMPRTELHRVMLLAERQAAQQMRRANERLYIAHERGPEASVPKTIPSASDTKDPGIKRSPNDRFDAREAALAVGRAAEQRRNDEVAAILTRIRSRERAAPACTKSAVIPGTDSIASDLGLGSCEISSPHPKY